jgi:O-antigen/teichoic acid export membrane protein
MVLQALTLVGKIVLLIGFARYLTPAQVGLYGLLVVALNLSVFLVGLDFHAFNTRELLRGSPEEAPVRVRDQFVVHGITYLLAFPLLLSLFFLDVLPWSLVLLFYALLVGEHVGRELQRVLVTLHRSSRAALVQLLRAGVWPYVTFGLMAYSPFFRNLETIAMSWAAAVATSLLLSGWWIRDLPWRRALSVPLDWEWMRRGLAVSLPLLMGSLALNGILSIDRLALDRFVGMRAVGVFTLYAAARNSILALLATGVVAVQRPKVIQAHQLGDLSLYRSRLKHMAWSVAGVSGALCACAAVAIWPVLAFVQKPVYAEHLSAYWILLLGTFVGALAEVPHTILYARHQDRAIVVSAVTGLAVAIGAAAYLVPRQGVSGAALATLVALLVMGSLKSVLAVRGVAPRGARPG